MSKMLVQCPTCQARIRVSERLLGKTKPCPRCQTVLQFPAEMAAESETEAAAGGEPAYPADSSFVNASASVGSYASPPVSAPVPQPPPLPPGYERVPGAAAPSGMSGMTSPPAYIEPAWIEEPQIMPEAEYSSSAAPSLPRLPTKRNYLGLVIISYVFKALACITLAAFFLYLLVTFIRYVTANNFLEMAAQSSELRILLLSTPFVLLYCAVLWALADLITMMIHFEENIRAIGICLSKIGKKYLS